MKEDRAKRLSCFTYTIGASLHILFDISTTDTDAFLVYSTS